MVIFLQIIQNETGEQRNMLADAISTRARDYKKNSTEHEIYPINILLSYILKYCTFKDR